MQPLWLPRLCWFVLRVGGSLEELCGRLPACSITTVRRPDGVHVLTERGTDSLQLLLQHGRMGNGRLFVDVPEEVSELTVQHRLLARFVLLGAHRTARKKQPRRGSPRSVFVLRSLDGWLTGEPHRRIAIGLYGAARTRREWMDGQLRDIVRRAIRRGRFLMNGGYLSLLR